MQSATFEAEKNRKAFTYTVIVCAILLLLFFIIKWQAGQVAPPHMPEDLIEINLGNDHEGFGETQPLIKGEMSPAKEATRQQDVAVKNHDEANQPTPDDNADKDAAAVDKVEKKTNKPTDIIKPAAKKPKPDKQAILTPKPQKPLITYNGPAKSKSGNNADKDNGFHYQGNKPGVTGDAGTETGNPDSYGKDATGRIGGGPSVTNGDRRILPNSYTFPGDLDKATIYAIIKVSEDGSGSFVDFDKNSTSRSRAYASAISEYLHHMKFNPTDHESNVTVQFNFTVR